MVFRSCLGAMDYIRVPEKDVASRQPYADLSRYIAAFVEAGQSLLARWRGM